MKKQCLISFAILCAMTASLAVGSYAAEAGQIGVESVKVNCSVHSDGQKVESIEVTYKDTVSLGRARAENFSMSGMSYSWSGKKDTGFRSAETHEFTASFSGVSASGNTLTLYMSDFPEKYYYVDSFEVTCIGNDALTFTKDQVTEVVTPVADDFEQYTKSFEEGPDLVYNLFTPEEAGEPLPLVLSLHGSGDQENTRANRVAVAWAVPAQQEKYPSYVLAPVMSDQSLEGMDEYVKQSISIIEDMISEGKVDPEQVYVTGKSLGGGNAVHAAALRPDLFAAALPLCPYAGGFEADDLTVLKDMPIWFLQGENDMAVPIEGTWEAFHQIQDAGSYKVKMREYRQNEMAARGIADNKHHDVEIIALEDGMYADWMFAQKKSPVNDAVDYIRVNTSVPARGQRPDTFELYVVDASQYEDIKPEDFTFEGEAFSWGGDLSKGYGCSASTHPFTSSIVDTAVEDGKVILTVGDFTDKYFFVDSFTVTCASHEELSFTLDDVRETVTAVADDFNHYSIGRAGRSGAFDYNLYCPVTDGEAVPLVLSLHGSGDQKNLVNSKLATGWAMPENQEVRKAFVLAPVFLDQSADAAIQIYSKTVNLIRQLISLGMVDPDRVYVTGKSMGGGNTGKIYTNYNGFFAAAMPLCGGFNDEIKGKIENLRNKPIWILQGDKDSLSLLQGSRNFYATLQEMGNEQAKYHEFTAEEIEAAGIGYHDIEILAMDDPQFAEWLFEQKRD